jgi:hypothetical protein
MTMSMNIKQLSKFDRYQRILEVCKGKVISCDIIADIVFIGSKSVLLDTRVLTKFGFLKETRFKVLHLGRPTKHYTTLIDKLDFQTFENMVHETAAYWANATRSRDKYVRKANKEAGTVTAIKNEALEPLYQLLGLVAHSEFKQLPSELITVYDINQNKDKVNESIRYDVKKSPRNYPGTSAGMVW